MSGFRNEALEIPRSTGVSPVFRESKATGETPVLRRIKALTLEFQVMRLSISTNPQFIALIERSRARMRAEGGISIDEVRRQLAANRRKRIAKRQGAKK